MNASKLLQSVLKGHDRVDGLAISRNASLSERVEIFHYEARSTMRTGLSCMLGTDGDVTIPAEERMVFRGVHLILLVMSMMRFFVGGSADPGK